MNWDEIRSRLMAVRLKLEIGIDPDPEYKNRVLRKRAEALAKPTETSEKHGDRLEVAEFLLSHERYGIELAHVREVCPLKEFTPLPCTPPFVLGIMNFRGQILSIVDLKKFFDLPDRGVTDLNRIIILHSRDMEFGILSDSILGVRAVPLSEMSPPPAMSSGVGVEYVRGVTKDRVIVLDGEKILSDKNIVVHQEV